MLFAHLKHFHIAVIRIGHIGHVIQEQTFPFGQIIRQLIHPPFQQCQLPLFGRGIIIFVLLRLTGNLLMQMFISVCQEARRNNRQQLGIFSHFIRQPPFKLGALFLIQIFVLMKSFHHLLRILPGIFISLIINNFHIMQHIQLQRLNQKLIPVGIRTAQPHLIILRGIIFKRGSAVFRPAANPHFLPGIIFRSVANPHLFLRIVFRPIANPHLFLRIVFRRQFGHRG